MIDPQNSLIPWRCLPSSIGHRSARHETRGSQPFPWSSRPDAPQLFSLSLALWFTLCRAAAAPLLLSVLRPREPGLRMPYANVKLTPSLAPLCTHALRIPLCARRSKDPVSG